MTFIKGPDFPTGGTIMGGDGIMDAYRSGKGRIYLRSKTEIENLRGGKQQIVITEVPFQIVKSRLVTSMENIRLEKKSKESPRSAMRAAVRACASWWS